MVIRRRFVSSLGLLVKPTLLTEILNLQEETLKTLKGEKRDVERQIAGTQAKLNVRPLLLKLSSWNCRPIDLIFFRL